MRQFTSRQQPSQAVPSRTAHPWFPHAPARARPSSGGGFDFSHVPVLAPAPLRVHPKLTVGPLNDPAERDADRVAEEMLRTPDPGTQGRAKAVRHVASERDGVPAPPVVQEALRGSGQPLDPAARAYFEPRFGSDLSHIRVHADAKAADSAGAIGARAYTAGRDIVFAAGQYAPRSESGRRLIAHELAHTSQQSLGIGKRVRRAPPDPAATPPAPTYTAASNFTELVTLIRTAEAKLKAKGQDVTTRLKTLRGLFYGTTWSMDFDHEHSAMRNLGFAYFLYGDPAIRTMNNAYALATGNYDKAAPDAAYVPADPASILGASLVKALKDSAEVTNPADNRKVDVGHLLIGMEARLSKGGQEKAQLNDPRPSLSPSPMGGTGLELTTWVGDLGGGTAQVAQLRVTSSSTTPAKHAFTGSIHDYGAEVNLEGDVAAFLAGLPASASDPYSITLDETKGVAGAIEDYVSPSGAGADWKGRAKRFLGLYGATFDASNALTNRAAVVTTFADHIKKFALYYKETRMKDELKKKLGGSPTAAQLAKIDTDMKAIETQIPTTATEVAGLFADALMVAVKDPSKGIVPP